MVVDKWRHYLHLNHFIIRTDHFSLKFLQDQKITTSLQHKGLTKLMGLSYEIHYKKGIENNMADALSRMHDVGAECYVISQIQPKCVEDIINSYDGDQEVTQIMTPGACGSCCSSQCDPTKWIV